MALTTFICGRKEASMCTWTGLTPLPHAFFQPCLHWVEAAFVSCTLISIAVVEPHLACGDREASHFAGPHVREAEPFYAIHLPRRSCLARCPSFAHVGRAVGRVKSVTLLSYGLDAALVTFLVRYRVCLTIKRSAVYAQWLA